jgi:hypothetical protein
MNCRCLHCTVEGQALTVLSKYHCRPALLVYRCFSCGTCFIDAVSAGGMNIHPYQT